MKSKVGLALGGGSARGYAHIGVLKFLEENEYEITEIGGTSMGAIIGSMIAFGMSSEEITKEMKRFNFFKNIDFDLKKGWMSGKKVRNHLDKIFEGKTIGDSKIPLTICSTDIETAENIIFSSETKVSDALRASFSLPSIFAPFEFQERELVDGGLTNNLPVDLLKAKNCIAVSVMGTKEGLQRKRRVFGREVKKNMLDLGGELFKKSYTILQQQCEVLALERARAAKKKVAFIDVQMPKIQLHDFFKIDAAIEAGYRSAQSSLEDKK